MKCILLIRLEMLCSSPSNWDLGLFPCNLWILLMGYCCQWGNAIHHYITNFGELKFSKTNYYLRYQSPLALRTREKIYHPSFIIPAAIRLSTVCRQSRYSYVKIQLGLQLTAMAHIPFFWVENKGTSTKTAGGSRVEVTKSQEFLTIKCLKSMMYSHMQQSAILVQFQSRAVFIIMYSYTAIPKGMCLLRIKNLLIYEPM